MFDVLKALLSTFRRNERGQYDPIQLLVMILVIVLIVVVVLALLDRL